MNAIVGLGGMEEVANEVEKGKMVPRVDSVWGRKNVSLLFISVVSCSMRQCKVQKLRQNPGLSKTC